MNTDIAARYPAGTESHTPIRASLLNFHKGSAHDLAFLPDKSVHAVITSPPYLGLRAYAGEQDVDWPEVVYAPMAGLPAVTIPAQRCALGGEADPFAYIGHLLHCLREWRRVLRADGVCMVNLGDSYNSAASNMQNGKVQRNGYKQGYDAIGRQKERRGGTLAPKNLILIPPRFALAAQADGWIVRADVVWAKGVSFLKDYAGSSMPESVQDRPSRSHENIYLLAKQERYFWDREAVAEEGSGKLPYGDKRNFKMNDENGQGKHGKGMFSGGSKEEYIAKYYSGTRNLRSVWVINPSGFAAAHFACWPESLVDPMIRATTSERGACPACGAAWVRVVEKTGEVQQRWAGGARVIDAAYNGQVGTSSVLRTGTTATKETTGFAPTCECNAGAPIPCTVLDPFSGSGTTGKVAVRLGRRYIGVDLADEYLGDVTDARMGAGVQMELVGA